MSEADEEVEQKWPVEFVEPPYIPMADLETGNTNPSDTVGALSASHGHINRGQVTVDKRLLREALLAHESWHQGEEDVEIGIVEHENGRLLVISGEGGSNRSIAVAPRVDPDKEGEDGVAFAGTDADAPMEKWEVSDDA